MKWTRVFLVGFVNDQNFSATYFKKKMDYFLNIMYANKNKLTIILIIMLNKIDRLISRQLLRLTHKD